MVGQIKFFLSKRSDSRLMKCTAVLHGGIYNRTSTPHKSGNKMKEKKKKKLSSIHNIEL